MPQQSSPPLQHPSPSPATQTSPSTAQASPVISAPPSANSSLDHRGQRGQPRQRSSVACYLCRRSKVKCENKGIHTTCASCRNKNVSCEYTDTPAAAGTADGQHRRESTAGDHDAHPRKRKKLLAASTGPRTGLGTHHTALDSPLLTTKVWTELFDIYKKHFAVDFPFIHKTFFFDAIDPTPVVDAEDTKHPPTATKRPHRASWLLAFLTQTSRFHPDLVEEGQLPRATANFYAEACRLSLGGLPAAPDLDLVQAYLMLGCHEWMNGEGCRGFLRIREAISCAQFLGLQFDADRAEHDYATFKEVDAEKDRFIEREIERRTMWTCFSLDRYLSMKQYCHHMVKVEEMNKVQLLCSDESFERRRRVKTRLFGEDDAQYEKRRNELSDPHKRLLDESDTASVNGAREMHLADIKWEVGEQEAESIFCIQGVDLLSDIVRWTLAKGRRQEGIRPPWDEKSNFKRLEDAFERFRGALPADLQLTARNTKDQYLSKTWDKYLTIHAICTLCTVVLYREYMAFAPWNLEKPKGPQDPPIITAELPTKTYWIDQAKKCWAACKSFAELLSVSKQRNAVVENPIVAFAAYSLGWCAVYCYFFPKMDPEKVFHRRNSIFPYEVANDYLLEMSKRFQKAEFWFRELQKVRKNYESDREKYRSVGGQPLGDSPSSTSSDRRPGAGLKEYAANFEKLQKEFGGQNFSPRDWDKDIHSIDTKLPEHPDYEDRQDAVTPGPVPKAESPEATISRAPSRVSTFTPVNQPERLPAATPEYTFAESSEKYPIHEPHLNHPAPQHPNGINAGYTYPVDPVHYPNYAAAYMPQSNSSSEQIGHTPQYFPAAFAPTQTTEGMGMYPAAIGNANDEQVRLFMEGRGIQPGDMATFSENIEQFPIHINPNTWMSSYGPWQFSSQGS